MPSLSPETARLVEAIKALPLGETRIMEVCGTHTMSIAKSGIKSLLPENVKLLSGPGCPVCVTPGQVIDAVLELAMRPDVIVTSYGDMLRVPGTKRGDSLARRKALGARVEIVYSPMDALELARNSPDKEIVFLGVGFETTAPGTAAAIMAAAEEGVKNFSVWPILKTVEPALRALLRDEDFNIQGFLCPGHVATILGERGFDYLPEEYGLAAVIAGFEPEEILRAIYKLLRQIAYNEPKVENEYKRAVSEKGNVLAQRILSECFVPSAQLWRGLGEIEGSGLSIKDELSAFDATKKFSVSIDHDAGEGAQSACRCGDVISGRIASCECPLFGKACTPEDPVGPCMVSSEGACAAAYKYQVI